MSHTRIKICGITRITDAQAVAHSGADALGLVFYAKSPRAVDIPQAQRIIRSLPPFITTVGLFVNAEPAYIQQVIDQVGIDLLQFHGAESPADCQQYTRPYIKALRMSPTLQLEQVAQDYASAQGLLLDTYVKGTPGGTGQAFDWTTIPPQLAPSIILAGGLTPHNAAQAIQHIHPYALDVSGGVEAQKGIKDTQKIQAFIQAAKQADLENQASPPIKS